MTALPKLRMTVDEFLEWSDGREGTYELVDGEVVAMAPERVRHAEVKFAACAALKAAIRKQNLPCRALIDGVGVTVDSGSCYVPDVLVYCGERADPAAMVVASPVIVVEVVSPSSRSVDTNRKLLGYFRLPSVMHYLVVEPNGPMVIHHRRGEDGRIEPRILTAGMLDLDPPGLSLPIAELFEET